MKANRIKYFFLVIGFTIVSGSPAYLQLSGDNELRISNMWLDQCFDLTKNTAGFSAPVAARSMAYFNICLYELGTDFYPENPSFSGKLRNYQRTVHISTTKKYYLPEVINAGASHLLMQLYANMPPALSTRLSKKRDSCSVTFKKFANTVTLKNSKEFGKKLASEIFEWSKLDGGDQGYLRNFPKTFQPVRTDSTWTITPPMFLSAQQPYWGNNQTLSVLPEMFSQDLKPLFFSLDTHSIMYKNSMEINLQQPASSELELIAEYWDDAPGYSGTPTGHVLSVTKQLARQKGLNYARTMEIYAFTSIAINDAFICCWKWKYQFLTLRPINYIQRYINPNFNSTILTPPFPEFPSGHSIQSSAAGAVLQYFFPQQGSFIDSTHYARTDIHGEPRTYNNLQEMIDEISISRMYGGIHYRYTLDESKIIGEKIGQQVIKNLYQ
jgi:PAP2 superfamily